MMRHATPRPAHSSLAAAVSRAGLVVVLAVLGAGVPLPAQTRAEDPWSAAKPVDPDQIGSGELLWRTERGWVPLPVADVEVELSITGLMIHGRLSQHFRNPTSQVIEAVYIFPLPDRAAVDHMELRVGERTIVSEIREKEEARRTYERARETGRKATLLEQQRPNLFTTSVANIDPGEQVEVVLEYFEEADYLDGVFSLRFPLSFTPRFAPPISGGPTVRESRGDAMGEDEPIEPGVAARPLVRIRVLLRPGFRLETVDSESHAIGFVEQDSALEVTTRPRRVDGDRDFLLSWKPEAGSEPSAAAFVEERDGERYLLAMVLPPAPNTELGAGLPTETLFVVDVSGSMAGPSIEQARAALLAALDRLRPEDRFDILVFNDQTVAFRPALEQAEEEPLEAARRWIAGLEAGGGTMIYPALMQALELVGSSHSSRAQRIVFITDGAVSNEQELLRALSERLGDVRLHTIGIGAAPNTYLMRKMARFGRGLCTFVADPSRADNAIAAFLERLDRPVMEGVELRTEGASLREVSPREIPDLYAGRPLWISAKLDDVAPGGRLIIGGYTRDGWLGTSVEPAGAVAPGSGVAVRWARSRVDELMDDLVQGGDGAAVRADVVELALHFDLVTPYTSLVAVEETPSALAAAAATVRSAAMLPMGGTDNPLRLLIGAILAATGLLMLAALRLRAWR